jgi:hypothetical protein
MTKRVWGDEARGGDDDGDAVPGGEQKVQTENSYFEKLKARLDQKPVLTPDSAMSDDSMWPKKPVGPVIYNDDGTVYKRPG